MNEHEKDPYESIDMDKVIARKRDMERQTRMILAQAESDRLLKEKSSQKSDGGPTSYYDFHPGWVTFNDFMEHKALAQWGAFSLHLKDVGKAICRFGTKAGTTQAYDARKIIYSGLRILMMIEGRDAAANEMRKLLADPQFQPTPETTKAASNGKDPQREDRGNRKDGARDEQVVLRVDRGSFPPPLG